MAFPSKITLSPLNSQIVKLSGLQNSLTGVYLNSAAVMVTLVDRSGKPVAGCTNLALIYDAGSNGNYQGMIDASFNPPVGEGYTLRVVATQDGNTANWSIAAAISRRTS
jgi:hypothetical protein